MTTNAQFSLTPWWHTLIQNQPEMISDHYLFTLTLIATCFCFHVVICCGNETSHESSCCLSVTWNGYGNACRTDGVILSVNGGNEIESGSWCVNDDENGSETWGRERTPKESH